MDEREWVSVREGGVDERRIPYLPSGNKRF